MSQTTRRFSIRAIWKWIFLTSPITSILILQAYILVPGRPYVWGKVSGNELACVLQGPMTPFGRAMFLGGVLRTNTGSSVASVSRVGVFFLNFTTDTLEGGYGFEADGKLYLRLSERRIWSVDPWRGDAQLVAVINAQEPLYEGEFSSVEFCVAGDTVWFEDSGSEAPESLFVQENNSPEPLFRSSDLFQILDCTEDGAYVASEGNGSTMVYWVSRDANRSKVLECKYLECLFELGDWQPGRFLYLRDQKGVDWFILRTGKSERRLVKAGKRYRGVFACDGNVFFLTYDLWHKGGPRTRIEELDIGSKEFVEDFWVDGVVKLLAADCPPQKSMEH